MASRLLAVLKRRRSAATLAVAVLFLVGPAGCSVLGPGEASYPTQRTRTNRGVGINKPSYEEPESIFGPGGLSLGGAKPPDDGTSDGHGGGGIGVNSFLWRASLDTVAFMPLVSADPFGGVIITDWYTPAESPSERMKVQVTILDRELRADGVRVSVFKQTQGAKGGGGWVDAQVDQRTNTEIENAILTRARQLRIAQGG